MFYKKLIMKPSFGDLAFLKVEESTIELWANWAKRVSFCFYGIFFNESETEMCSLLYKKLTEKDLVDLSQKSMWDAKKILGPVIPHEEYTIIFDRAFKRFSEKYL